MRIISGKYKKSNLLTLDGNDITRPTKDMVKEALFSSIEINEDCEVLDLFSGSGAIGIEALSRGAKDAVFNDLSKEAYKIIKTNLAKFKEDRLVYNLDYKEVLNKLNGRQFDFIYLDPPYAFKEYENIFELIYKYNLLKETGIIVVEVRKDVDLNNNYYKYINYKEKRYGINKLEYYR